MLHKLRNWIIRILRMRGSWTWACQQMQAGHIVYKTSDPCRTKYRLDTEVIGRILWAYEMSMDSPADRKWKCSNIYDGDYKCTAWAIWEDA